jgi:tetraacyldisaccharide 4'-kinase
VSVGNLHWGGGGKTPLVAALAKHLSARGLRPAILSRGYGGKGKGVRFVGLGEGPALDPWEAGDEPVLLARCLPNVPVVVGTDRAAAGRAALARLNPAPGVFLLDDGFSHLRLRRDLDLLVFPDADLFAGGRLLPSGRLREPLDSVRHAHAVLLTGARIAGPSGEDLAEALRPWGFTGAGFTVGTVAQPAKGEDGSTLPEGTPVVALAAIARPESFFAAVDRQGLRAVDRITFHDHYPYREEALREIERRRGRAGAAWVVTTAKDAVKLRGRLEAPLATIDLVAQPEPAFWTWFDARLGRAAEKAQ